VVAGHYEWMLRNLDRFVEFCRLRLEMDLRLDMLTLRLTCGRREISVISRTSADGEKCCIPRGWRMSWVMPDVSNLLQQKAYEILEEFLVSRNHLRRSRNE
jgi:hypothetical protein